MTTYIRPVETLSEDNGNASRKTEMLPEKKKEGQQIIWGLDEKTSK